MIWIGVLGAMVFLIGVWSLIRQPAREAPRKRRRRDNKLPPSRRKMTVKQVPSDQPPVVLPKADIDDDDVEITLVRAQLPAETLAAAKKSSGAKGGTGSSKAAPDAPAAKSGDAATGAGAAAAGKAASGTSGATATATQTPNPGKAVPDISRLGDEDDVEVDVGAGATTVAIYPDDEPEAALEEPTQPVVRILVSAHAQTDQGLVRRRNEDSFLVMNEHGIFCVADGMGGYAGGKVASELAVATLRQAFDKGEFGDGPFEPSVPRRGAEVAAAVQLANSAVYTKAQGDTALSQMGTTVVAARFSPAKQRVYIAHVGDSRAYRLRSGKIRRLTTDHTMKHLGFAGPGSEHLYRAVGIAPAVDVDLIIDKPRADDIYLLCSDGLTKMAKDDAIARILRENADDIEAAVYSLIEIANDSGGKDNVTCIVVKVVEKMPIEKPRQHVDLEN